MARLAFFSPFDLVIPGRPCPPIPPSPPIDRDIRFPVCLIEVTTPSLLASSPLVRLSTWTLLVLAARFVAAITLFVGPGSAAVSLPTEPGGDDATA